MPAITNKDIMHKLDDHSDKLATVIERLKIVDDHEKTLYGDDKRGGLTADVNSAKTLSRAAIGVVSVASLILGIMQSLTGCSPVASPPQQTASALNATYEAAATPPPDNTRTPVEYATDTPAPTETPTPTLTPCCGTPIVTVTPYPTVVTTGIPGITEVSEEDVQILARLCATEVRAMRALREDACLSIIATVDKRIRLGKYSDGSIRGTVGWNCRADSITCQYPASVIWGCDGFKSGACWWDFTDDVRWFEPTVWRYFFGERGRCDNYLNYGSRDSDMVDCVIEDNGQREGFFDGE